MSNQTEFPIYNAVENLDCSVPLSMAHVKDVLSHAATYVYLPVTFFYCLHDLIWFVA